MAKSVKTVIFVIGTITLAAGLYSLMKGKTETMTYFALFLGVALIATALFTKNSSDILK